MRIFIRASSFSIKLHCGDSNLRRTQSNAENGLLGNNFDGIDLRIFDLGGEGD